MSSGDVDPGSFSVGYTLYQMHSEPGCLPDGPEKDAHRAGLEKASAMMGNYTNGGRNV